jgi:hypothetical protein
MSSLQLSVTRLARVNLGLCLAYAVFIAASDAWALVTRQLTSQRWLMFGVLLIVTALVWALSRNRAASPNYYRVLIFALISAEIALATFTIYTERGMASRGVALYAIPIVASAVMLSRRFVFAVATLCTAAYVMAATRYFYVYFNEGYKIELYSTLFIYSASFFVLAWILAIVLDSTNGRLAGKSVAMSAGRSAKKG